METITLGQIQNVLVFLIAIGASLGTITKVIKTSIEKGLKPIHDKIDKVDKNATMNYLVSRISEIDKGEKMDGVARKRFFDEYQHYTEDLKGNSYISTEVKRLEREGKL